MVLVEYPDVIMLVDIMVEMEYPEETIPRSANPLFSSISTNVDFKI